MGNILEHRHLIVSATINKPPKDTDIESMNVWFKDLVHSINMKILMGPYLIYSNMIGNKGFTGVTIIETSHIAMHIWDETNPAKMELDVYTCSYLDVHTIFNKIKQFDPVDINHIYIDRNKQLEIVSKNQYSKARTIQWE